MRKLYVGLVRFFDNTLLSVLVGIISGVAVNIGTGDETNMPYECSIFLMSASVLCLIILTRLRQQTDDERLKRTELPMSPSEKWATAADSKNNKRVFLYYTCLSLFIAFFCAGIYMIHAGNREKKEKQLWLDKQGQRIDRLVEDSLHNRWNMQQLRDSFQTAHNTAVPD